MSDVGYRTERVVSSIPRHASNTEIVRIEYDIFGLSVLYREFDSDIDILAGTITSYTPYLQ